uniref:Uncharacterized protein n=1 Tax=Tetranychus urticae TaxID=32264 RepID=T1KVG9_TETUR
MESIFLLTSQFFSIIITRINLISQSYSCTLFFSSCCCFFFSCCCSCFPRLINCSIRETLNSQE